MNPSQSVLTSATKYENTEKYLGMTLDAKLRWKANDTKKREKIRYRGMYTTWEVLHVVGTK